MSENYRIKYGDSSFTLRRELPGSYSTGISAATCTVKDENGTTLQAADTATIYTATVTAAAIAAGEASTTLDSGAENLVAGDLIRLSNPVEDMRVESYNSSTKVVTFTEYCEHAHASGIAVTGRWMTYALDASDTDSYTTTKKLRVEWVFTTDDKTLVDTAIVETYHTELGALEDHFRNRYRKYYESYSGDFAVLESDAQKYVETMFKTRDRDISKLVAIVDITELIMITMAHMIAISLGDDWSAERDACKKEQNEQFDRFASASFWTDTNDDGIKDDYENQPADMPYMRRNIL